MWARVETPPAVDFELLIHGEGDVRRGDHAIHASAITLRRQRYRPDQLWTVELRVSKEDREDRGWLVGEGHVIEGRSDDNTPFYVTGFVRTRGPTVTRDRRGGRVWGVAQEVRTGTATLAQPAVEQTISVFLTDNRMALPLVPWRRRTKEGLVTGERQNDPFILTSPAGEGDFWQGYEVQEIRVGGAHCTAEVPQSLLRVDVPRERLTVRPAFLIDELRDWLSDLALVLSFLCRTHVGFYRVSVASVLSEAEGAHQTLDVTEVWTPAPQVHVVVREQSLVAPGRMEQDSLQLLLDRFRSHELKEAIEHTIGYVIESLSRRQLATTTAFAFTALETIINAVGQAEGDVFILPDPTFRTLLKRARRQVKAICKDLGIAKAQRQQLYSKLNELQRRPFIQRTVEIVTELGVEWKDLWPGADDLVAALRATYERRSRFVHRGTFEDIEASTRDTYRAAHLAERIVFALLDGDPAWVPEGAPGGRLLAPSDVGDGR